jgi:signal transduction histidine kinase
MPPTHSASLTLPEEAPRSRGAGNGAEVQPGIDGGHARDAFSRFDPLMARARVEKSGAAYRLKNEFLATVCHELRSPIGAIQNAVNVLRRRGRTKVTVQHHMHEVIDRQAKQMAFLVAGLLDITRIDRGQLALRRERVDLRTVLRNAVETLEWDLRGRSHRLSLRWPESSVWLVADAARLEQVFVNLLGNASKYTEMGGELGLSLHVSDGSAVVRVRDSGIGIAPDVLPRIFDLFMQADTAAPRSGCGLGIGLALVRAIVESHGGSATAVSAGLGQGSEFTVRLPLEY